jgi:hypothetical protein
MSETVLTGIDPLTVRQLSSQIDTLTEVNSDDILRGFGLHRVRFLRTVLRWMVRRPAQRFARTVAAYDAMVEQYGLACAGRWMVGQVAAELAISGEELPLNGPLLIVANHPGLCDAVALFAAINRADLRTIAAERSFLSALPHTSAALLTTGDGTSGRVAVLRQAARHLRSDGALLTFPAGRIEPDPALMPGAEASLRTWPEHIDGLLRLAPQATVIPAIVSAVYSVGALHHPLTRLRRREADRQWLAAILQLMLPALHTNTVRVRFGRAVAASTPEALSELLAEARRLVAAR